MTTLRKEVNAAEHDLDLIEKAESTDFGDYQGLIRHLILALKEVVKDVEWLERTKKEAGAPRCLE